MANFQWDAKRYFWPRKAVLHWWEQGWDWDSLLSKACPCEGYETYGKYFEQDFPLYRAPDSEKASAEAADGKTDLAETGDGNTAAGDESVSDVKAVEPELTERGYWGKRWLIDFAGKKWTPYHLPLFDPATGALSPKHPDYDGSEQKWTPEDHAAFAAGLMARMKAGRSTEFDSDYHDGRQLAKLIGDDLRAPLSAVVVPPNTMFALLGETIHVVFDDALFADNVVFWEQDYNRLVVVWPTSFGNGTSFKNALFGADLLFARVSFGELTSFENASFQESANFYNCRFAEFADFAHSTFNGSSAFRKTEFGWNACFNHVLFGSYASFDDATILGCSFKRTWFGRRVSFKGTRFRSYASFQCARFFDWADFSLGTDKEDGFRYGEAEQVTIAVEENESQGLKLKIHFKAEIDARKDRTFDHMYFRSAEFWGGVDFENRVFGQSSDFEKAIFYHTLRMHGTDLHPDTVLVGTKFWPAPGKMPPKSAREARRVGKGTKARALIRAGNDYAIKMDEIEKAQLKLFAARESYASKEEQERLENAVDLLVSQRRQLWMDLQETDEATRYAVVCAARYRLQLYFGRWESARKKARVRDVDERDPQVTDEYPSSPDHCDHIADDFESAFRRIKILMAGIGSRIEEQRFFTYEIKSRLKRRDNQVRAIERFFGQLYGLTADFGRSISRPVAFIVILSAAFTGGLASVSWFAGKGMPGMFLLNYFLKSLPPSFLVREQSILGFGGADYVEWLHSVLSTQDVVLSSVVTLHQLMNLILWFLFALALRRRFQIT